MYVHILGMSESWAEGAVSERQYEANVHTSAIPGRRFSTMPVFFTGVVLGVTVALISNQDPETMPVQQPMTSKNIAQKNLIYDNVIFSGKKSPNSLTPK